MNNGRRKDKMISATASVPPEMYSSSNFLRTNKLSSSKSAGGSTSTVVVAIENTSSASGEGAVAVAAAVTSKSRGTSSPFTGSSKVTPVNHLKVSLTSKSSGHSARLTSPFTVNESLAIFHPQSNLKKRVTRSMIHSLAYLSQLSASVNSDAYTDQTVNSSDNSKYTVSPAKATAMVINDHLSDTTIDSGGEEENDDDTSSLLLSNVMQVDTSSLSSSINHGNVSQPSWQFTDSISSSGVSSLTSKSNTTANIGGKSKSPQIRMKGKMRRLKNQQQSNQSSSKGGGVGSSVSDGESNKINFTGESNRLNGFNGKSINRSSKNGKRIITLEEAEMNIRYRIEVYDSDKTNLLANVTNEKRPSFWINGLIPSTKYVMLIYAESYIGRSDALLMQVITADLPVAETVSSESKKSMGKSNSGVHESHAGDESVTRATFNLPLMTKSPAILLKNDEHSDSDASSSLDMASSSKDVASSTSLHSNSHSNQLFSFLKKEYFAFLSSNSILILIAIFSVILPSIMLLFIVSKIIKRKRLNQLSHSNSNSDIHSRVSNGRKSSASSSREAIQMHNQPSGGSIAGGTLTNRSRRSTSVSISSIDQSTSHHHHHHHHTQQQHHAILPEDDHCNSNKMFMHDTCDLSPESAAAEHILQLNTYLNSNERLLDTYASSNQCSVDESYPVDANNYYTLNNTTGASTSTTSGKSKKSSLKQSAGSSKYLSLDHTRPGITNELVVCNEHISETNDLHHHRDVMIHSTCDCNNTLGK